MELHRRFEAMDRLSRERHDENKETLREIRESGRAQVEATESLRDTVAIQNGRVTTLEFGHRDLRRDLDTVQQRVTEAVVGAIRDSAPTRKALAAMQTRWTGATAGAILALSWVVKLVLEALHWIP